MPLNNRKKVYLISLGCDKNLADSEKILGLLGGAGYDYTDSPYGADVIVVNTCCFIRDAKEESVNTLIEMADIKKELGEAAPKLIVMGCMAERYKDEITEVLPEVDGIIGTNSWQDIAEELRSLEAGESGNRIRDFKPISENMFKVRPVTDRVITGAGHYAYLKIAEGCGKNCTYCIIPSLKGSYRSVPMEDLIAEAEKLAASGVKELILVAQETTLYGVDLYGGKKLPELLKRLNDIEGLKWIRILYCYPEEVTEELIRAIRDLPKVCHYLDVPIQHASDHILRRMARKTTRREITERIGRLRQEIPDICLRTTMISGFPGETDADHKILLEFVREMEFDRLGDFTYSREEGTKAAAFSHQVSKRLKEERRGEVMALQQEIAFRKAEKQIGRELRVLIEGRLSQETEENVYVARTYMDAPGVDGYIYVHAGKREFMTGDMPKVRVTAAREYDLIGELVE